MKTFYIVLVSLVGFTLVQGQELPRNCSCEPGPPICASNFQTFNGVCDLLCYNYYNTHDQYFKIYDGPCINDNAKNFELDHTRSQQQNQGLSNHDQNMVQFLDYPNPNPNNKQQKTYNLNLSPLYTQQTLLDQNKRYRELSLEPQAQKQKLVHVLTDMEQLLFAPFFQNSSLQNILSILQDLLKQLQESSPKDNLLYLHPQILTGRQQKLFQVLKDTKTLLELRPEKSSSPKYLNLLENIYKQLDDISKDQQITPKLPQRRNQQLLKNNNNQQDLLDQQSNLDPQLLDLSLSSSLRRRHSIDSRHLNSNRIHNYVNSLLFSDSQNLSHNNNRRLSNEHSQLLNDTQYLNNYIRRLSERNSPLLSDTQNINNIRRLLDSQILSDSQNSHNNNNRRSASNSRSLNNNERRILNKQFNEQLSVSDKQNIDGNRRINQNNKLSLRQKRLLEKQQNNLNVAKNMNV